MNKKIIVLSILTVFTLVSITMATAVNNENTVEKKASPLFKRRMNDAITYGKKFLNTRFENILTNFLGARIFIRFSKLNKLGINNDYATSNPPSCTFAFTCAPTLHCRCPTAKCDINL